jgi:hypothetical protein
MTVQVREGGDAEYAAPQPVDSSPILGRPTAGVGSRPSQAVSPFRRIWAMKFSSNLWTVVTLVSNIVYGVLIWFLAEKPGALGPIATIPWYLLFGPGLVIAIIFMGSIVQDMITGK